MKFLNKYLMRYFWITVGLISFILGTIGIVLPLLPTVPFYLLTIYCFAKGSSRLHQWFLKTNLYKKYLADFIHKRTMNTSVKFRVICIITIIMGIVYYFIPAKFYWVQYIIFVIWMIHIIYLVLVIRTDKN